ncbi:GGDEF domain-containing protein [Sporomusa malonica]|uniref:Diguanylate cyclase (GGDEF) domain-containing protein n=1 Tax=Sporomusa malonica TaxID=112901 RepID=A0A1W2DMI1_9FIRM|nr:diguanylate cyclase [Sporomusa malonica]SMC98258.1 diguanylate cyclase (GGDEF) domain-containing protein [Sporomusa malonica]
MIKKSVSVLVICEVRQYREIKMALSDAILDTCFSLWCVGRLQEGLKVLDQSAIDVVLLVFALSDSHGISGLMKIRNQYPDVPVVVMVESSDAAVAISAVRDGAQDVLVKQEVLGSALARSLLYAIERQRIIKDLQTASLFDELTGLYNRRGFMNLARHYVQVSGRSRRGMILFYADLDKLKFINDNLGHQVGDEAIISTARILKGVFRTSDIVARIGGDEFVALALDADSVFATNILERLKAKGKDSSQSYLLSLSVGYAFYDPENPCTIEELLAKADKNMYEDKLAKRNEKKKCYNGRQLSTIRKRGQYNC